MSLSSTTSKTSARHLYGRRGAWKPPGYPMLSTLVSSPPPDRPAGAFDLTRNANGFKILGNGPDSTLTVNGGQPVGDCGIAMMINDVYVSCVEEELPYDYPTSNTAVSWYLMYDGGVDNGVVNTQLFAYLRANKPPWGNKLVGVGGLPYQNFDESMAYICATGTGCWGIVVTQQMEDQTTNNEPWDLTGPPNPEDILGGHDVLIIPTMDADGNFEVVTWGQRQKVTQRCFKYVSEELDSTIVGAQTGKLNKYGVDYDKLESYMKLLDNNPLLPAAK